MIASSSGRSLGSLSLLLILGALLAGSCEPLRLDRHSGPPRSARSASGTSRSQRDSLSEAPASIPTPRPGDILVSGVAYPDGYDWRRDTSFGTVSARIVVLLNAREVLSVPVGEDVSPASDRHFLLGGHLYSWGRADGSTLLRKDGSVVLRYEGEEHLRGLFVRDGDIYTLGQNAAGTGFSLRRNGQIEFSRSAGDIRGGLSERAYCPTGALYADAGHLVFSYRTESKWYVVTDGVEAEAPVGDAGIIMDLRVIDGDVYTVGTPAHRYGVFAYKNGQKKDLKMFLFTPESDFRIYRIEGDVVFFGTMHGADPGQKFCAALRYDQMEKGVLDIPGIVPFGFEAPRAYLYPEEDGWGVDCPACGKQSLGACYFMSARCGYYLDGALSLALTYRSAEQAPAVWHDGVTSPVEINGYLTSIEAF